MAASSLLCLLLAVCVFESTTATVVQDPNSPSDTEDWTEHINRIQDYSTQTAPGVCQLSTCELLLRELGATEQRMAHMEEKIRDMETRLQASEDQAQQLASLSTKVAAMEGELQTSRNEIVQLKSEIGVKVAFSAYLGGHGHVGPYSTDVTLEYQNVLTNIGNAYKPATGHFVTPLRGIYYFYICYHAGQQTSTYIALFKNSQLIATTGHRGDINKGLNENGSNGVILQLEKGDQVYVVLRAHSWVWDGTSQTTVFTGFLLKQL